MRADPDGPDGRGGVFDAGLQHERTALAWERTAIATMVAGILFARYTAISLPVGLAAFGVAQVVVGACILVWTGRRYDDLHGPLLSGDSPVHPLAAGLVGVTTVLFTGVATALAIVIAVS